MVDFFSGHSHHTVFSGDVSHTRSITASIIQGSSIGSAAYTVVTVWWLGPRRFVTLVRSAVYKLSYLLTYLLSHRADLRPLNPDNIFIKFAEDTYLVISVANINTRAAEIDNIAAWATENNLKLN